MDSTFAVLAAAGFVAQMVDGAIGMGYGVITMSALVGFGIPPLISTASIHATEVVLAAVSGGWHRAFGNIDGPLLRSLILPGVAGAAAGAFTATRLPARNLTIMVAVYLVIVGALIIRKAFVDLSQPSSASSRNPSAALGIAGGFCDAVGGGGWGAIVSSTLISRGNLPRYAVGTVNAAEFFIAAAASTTFLLSADLRLCREVILALLAGGMVAAPLAAWLARILPARKLMILVGAGVIILSLRTLLSLFFR